MMMAAGATVQIRVFTLADYPWALDLWTRIEGLGLTESDAPAAVAAFLDRNPAFSAVAVSDAGDVVGAVLWGHNGRAGSLHHLAVDKRYRGQGFGRALVEYCLSKLDAADIPRCNIFVYTENEQGNRFWLRTGWNDPTAWKVLQKRVEERKPTRVRGQDE